MIYAFFQGSRPVGQIRQISYIGLLEKNIGNPQRFLVRAMIFENKNKNKNNPPQNLAYRALKSKTDFGINLVKILVSPSRTRNFHLQL